VQLVLYKVVPIGTGPEDITLQMLGFYDIHQPYLLSFSPKDFSAMEQNQSGVCAHVYKNVITKACSDRN